MALNDAAVSESFLLLRVKVEVSTTLRLVVAACGGRCALGSAVMVALGCAE